MVQVFGQHVGQHVTAAADADQQRNFEAGVARKTSQCELV